MTHKELKKMGLVASTRQIKEQYQFFVGILIFGIIAYGIHGII